MRAREERGTVRDGETEMYRNREMDIDLEKVADSKELRKEVFRKKGERLGRKGLGTWIGSKLRNWRWGFSTEQRR